MRTRKLPAGRPLPAGRVSTAPGPLAARRPRAAGRRKAAGRRLTANRAAAVLGVVLAVLAASACAGSPAATGPSVTGAPASAAAGPAAAAQAKAVAPVSVALASPGSGVTGSASCPTADWAYEVGSKGKVLWKVSLPLAPSDGVNDGLQPVLNGAGSQAVLAEGHSLVALRLSDGHRLWRRVFPQAKNSFTGQVSFLYGFHGAVIALVGQVSADSRLVALSQRTGAILWTLPLGGDGVLGTPVVTIDSVLAFLTPHGRLAAASLWTGKLLWSRGYASATDQPRLAAEGSAVIAAKSSDSATSTAGTVTAFASQHGKPLWTRTGMARQPTLLATRGGVLVYDVDQNIYPQPALFPVTELNPATGKTVWRIPTASPVSAVWSSPDGSTVAIATAGRIPRLIMADPLAHRVNWSAAAAADPDTAPLIEFNHLLYVKTTSTSAATLVDRDTSSGKVRWSLPVPSALPRYLAFTGNGTWLLSYGQATVPGKAGALVIGLTGKQLAKVSLPAPAQAPPAVTAGHDTVLQLDTLACATSTLGGSAVGTAASGTAAGGAG